MTPHTHITPWHPHWSGHLALPREGDRLKLAIRVGAVMLLLLALWLAREPLSALLKVLEDQEAVRHYVLDHGAWGPLLLALTQLLQVIVAIIPGHVLLVASGYIYGFLPGLALNLVTLVVASQIAFALARKAGRPFVQRLVAPDVLQRFDRFGEQCGPLFLMIALMIPIVPGDVLNLVAGLSPISAPRFLLANTLGRLPVAILLTLVGSHGLHLPPWAWVAGAAVLVAVVAVWLGREGWGRINQLTNPGFAGLQ